MADDSTRNTNQLSAEAVANNDDLLNQILVGLPIRSLLRFKSVSRHWLSLIIQPHFVRRRSLNSEPSGLFLESYSKPLFIPEFDFIPFNNLNPTKPPFTTQPPFTTHPTFVGDPSRIRNFQSCNGLLLCHGRHLYIYNPTTNQFTTTPEPPTHRARTTVNWFNFVCYSSLAFDPSKSPHYKVVSVYSSKTLSQHYDVEIFSSQTGLWTPSSTNPLRADNVNFKNGVFWNGALHWIGFWGADSLYLNIEDDRFRTLPTPPTPEGRDKRGRRNFRESRGHLHLIDIYGSQTKQFNVYEMESDYSAWFVKYRVDLDAIPTAFPEMVCNSLDYDFFVLSLVRRENDDESFLVLHIPGKIVRYNFQDNSFSTVLDFPPSHKKFRVGALYESFEYIESLAYV
ncbi:F-box protein [Camellia lanceoleosa]|uniref:F-box protein n=1 Tax=Camellia lanceoleosa TaxID=1840588 RepID=A0ACC0J5Z0_9ERIC|nr:F-box protein [Camellia lanceoleosa]